MAPTFGSLFAGIGGIDLGLERAGWAGRWQVEYEPFCQRVLARHWPDVVRYGDIRDVDWSTVEPVDLVAGGFPCQPFSLAGSRLGKDDERWLWPEFARALGVLRPGYVLVENVPGLLAGHGGMGAVLGDLADLGYDAEWDSIPASAVGAPHLRYRVWIVAYTDRPGPQGHGGAHGLREASWQVQAGGLGPVPDADSVRLARPRQPLFRVDPASADSGATGRTLGDGLGDQWQSEPDVGRVADGVPARVDRLRALGNAVVPQVVEWIGRRIIEEAL